MIRISCVNYLNSIPFIYGLKNNAVAGEIDLSLDIPSVCADKLSKGNVDIGLVPVIQIPELAEHYVVSDFCIGADGKVETVLLLSQVPIQEIKTVFLDSQSRTSVVLAKVLADKFWNIRPVWIDAAGSPAQQSPADAAWVMIGDKTFEHKKNYRVVTDLAEEWKNHTSLPFVFACWVANKRLSPDFLSNFNAALKSGLEHRNEIAREQATAFPSVDVKDYLFNKISYALDDKKLSGMKLFLDYAKDMLVQNQGNTQSQKS